MNTKKPINSESLHPAAGFRKKHRLIATVSLVACVLLLSISVLQALSGVARAASTVPFQKAFLEHGENAFDFGTQNGLKTREYEANKARYGFKIDPIWQPYKMNDIHDGWGSEFYPSGLYNHDYAVYVQQVFLQNTRDKNVYAFAYRVIMSPNDNTEWYGFLNMFRRGERWINKRQKTTVQLRGNHRIGDWAPKNKPNNTSGSIGIGADSGGLTIGASIDWNHWELTINSRTNTGNNYFEAEYVYDRGFWDWFWGGASDYMKNDVVSYGFFTFYTTGRAYVDIEHTGEFENMSNGSKVWGVRFRGAFGNGYSRA